MKELSEYTYGITKQYKTGDKIDACCEDLVYKGYTILENILSPAEVSEYYSKTMAAYNTQANEFGVENLKKINDENIVRAPLCYDKSFLKLAVNDTLLQIAKRYLGENHILIMQNGIINKPENSQFQAKWHRDLNYQHWVSSKPLSLNALYCLTDFNEVTGGTHVLPSTHLVEEFPSYRYVVENELCAKAKAGSLIIMNAMLYHRAGVNTSKADRVGINHVIGLPFLSQPVNFSECLTLAGDEVQYASYFGFNWSPARSPKAWRDKKLTQKSGGNRM